MTHAPPRSPAPFPSFLGALFLFVWIQVAAWLLAAGIGRATGEKTAAAIGLGVAYAVGIALALRRRGAPRREVLPLGSIPPLATAAVGLSVIGLFVVSGFVSGLIERWIPPPERFVVLMDRLLGDAFSWPTFLLVVGIAPIGEELVCRGLVLSSLARRCGARRAVAASASLFAIIHLNPWQGVGAFAAGLLFGWWVLRLGSLWPAIGAHVAVNGLTYAVHLSPESRAFAWAEGGAREVAIAVLGALALAAGVVAIRRLPRTAGVSWSEGGEERSGAG